MQVGDKPMSVGTATKTSQRFEHRQIRFAAAILLYALAAPDRYILRRRCLRYEGIDQRSLANPGLSYDEPHAAHAVLCCLPPLRELSEFCIAPNEMRRPFE
jgi:hypothetical protein